MWVSLFYVAKLSGHYLQEKVKQSWKREKQNFSTKSKQNFCGIVLTLMVSDPGSLVSSREAEGAKSFKVISGDPSRCIYILREEGGGVLCAQRNNRSRQFDETAAVRGRVDERRHRSILLLSPSASYCGYVWVKAAAISALCSEWLMSELRAVIRKCGQAPGVVATVDMSREISPLELLTCLLPAHWGRTRRDEILWIKGPQFR